MKYALTLEESEYNSLVMVLTDSINQYQRKSVITALDQTDKYYLNTAIDLLKSIREARPRTGKADSEAVAQTT